MRIAIIADIHGNMAALEAVLADLAQQDVDETIIAGDMVNRGPESAAVLRRLAPLGWRTIMGNHEELLLQFLDERANPAWLDDPWWATTRFSARDVGHEWRDYMAGLPPELLIQPEGTSPIRLVHGSPRHFMEGIGPRTPPDLLDEMMQGVTEPMLACAHTHYSMIRPYGETTIVNVGAVGLPFNHDPRAQYALFQWGGDAWEPTLRQVEYDLARTEAAYERTGFLASGGVGAWLLREELRQAQPHLVPFWRYCQATHQPLDFPSLDGFLQARDEYI